MPVVPVTLPPANWPVISQGLRAFHPCRPYRHVNIILFRADGTEIFRTRGSARHVAVPGAAIAEAVATIHIRPGAVVTDEPRHYPPSVPSLLGRVGREPTQFVAVAGGIWSVTATGGTPTIVEQRVERSFMRQYRTTVGWLPPFTDIVNLANRLSMHLQFVPMDGSPTRVYCEPSLPFLYN